MKKILIRYNLDSEGAGYTGCIECLTLLVTEVLLGFSKNELTKLVILYLKAVYDCVNIIKKIRNDRIRIIQHLFTLHHRTLGLYYRCRNCQVKVYR